jgi:hypothetical protein
MKKGMEIPERARSSTRRRKKLFLWIVGILGSLCILLAVILLLLPFLVNLEPVKHRILAHISREIAAEAQFRKVAIELFPRPRVVIQEAGIAIPGKIRVAVEGLTLVPQIIPLLTGKARISFLQARAPTVTLELPGQKPEKEEPLGLSSRRIADSLRSLLVFMESKAPRLTLLVEKGRLTLTKGRQPVFRFQDIQGHAQFPPDQLQLDLACNSNLWGHMSVEARLGSKELTGAANIQVTDIHPQPLLNYLVPAASPALEGSGGDLKISLEVDRRMAFRGKIQGSSPSLAFQRGEKKWFVKGVTVNGAFQLQEDRATVSLTELLLENPRARLSGELKVDLEAPRFRLKIAGREMEVSPVREIALGLAGEAEPVRTIFDILRGGEIPHISLETHGRSPADLGRLKNVTIQGKLLGGRIFLSESLTRLRGIHFDLTQARGSVRLSRGILEGKNLGAQWGKARVSRGSLKLGLEGGDAPFHLDVLADVDLTQLPPFLKKMIRNQAFAEEMDRFQELQGKSRARLILGESLKSIRPRIEVEELSLRARYDRLPYPLKVESARGGYDGAKIEIQNLTGAFGQSSFSDISARITLGKTPDILVGGGKCSIVLGEIYAWLNSVEKLKATFEEIRSLKGTVTLSSINLKGPLSRPEKWDYRLGGEIEKLAVEASIMPGPLALTAAKFEVEPEKILLHDSRVNLLDASLRVSAECSGWQKGISMAEGTFQGNLGAKVIEWASTRFRLPPNLRTQAPLSISRAHLGWGPKDGISFTAHWQWPGGPDASIDLLYTPEVLTVNRLFITDDDSRAEIGLKWRPEEMRLEFKGNLLKRTVDRILVKNEFLAGSLHGDFHSHLFINAPLRSTARGSLAGAGLDLAPVAGLPLVLKSFSLEAEKKIIRIQTAALSWEDRRVTLQGSVDFSAEAFLVDMDVAVDGLQWEKIKKVLNFEGRRTEAAQGGKRKFPPLRGKIRFKTPYFEYQKFTWRPLDLEVTFLPEEVNVTVTEARVCGISTPGAVRFASGGMVLNFHPLVESQDFSSTMECLLGKPFPMSGNLHFGAQIKGQGQPRDLVQSLHGPLELELKDGWIYRESTVSKILAFLNLTDLMEKDRGDRAKREMSYKEIQARGELQGGKLLIQELHMDAPAMQLVSQGEIDWAGQKIDFKVVVAPLKTVDWIVQRIPIIGYVLQGTLISIPVRVQGDLKDPRIIPLDPSLVGSELVGIMKRTLKLPFKLVQPLVKDHNKPEPKSSVDPQNK